MSIGWYDVKLNCEVPLFAYGLRHSEVKEFLEPVLKLLENTPLLAASERRISSIPLSGSVPLLSPSVGF